MELYLLLHVESYFGAFCSLGLEVRQCCCSGADCHLLASYFIFSTLYHGTLSSSVYLFPPWKGSTISIVRGWYCAGAYGYANEGRNEARGDGRGEGRGEGRTGYVAEGRIDSRGDARGDSRGDARAVGDGGLEVGIGGFGSNDGAGGAGIGGRHGSPSHPVGSYPPANVGHGLPGVYRTRSDGSYNPSDGRPEQGSLPFMMNNSLPYGGSYERRPESSYGGRGDDSSKGGGSSKNTRKMADSESEDGDSAGGPENSSDEPNARTLKRPRLVWTPQLHKRFVDAVGHLGIKNAVPKTIMQLMNVEGLTRENVASHLQKYRLYLKRMQGLSNDGPSASDQLFASTPLPQSLGGPHYMPNHRDEVGPPSFTSPAVPMPFQALGPDPLGPTHYGAYEHHPYSAMGRGLPQRPPMSDRRNQYSDNENNRHQSHSHGSHNHSHNQPSSPPQRILTLFPTSSH